jgi:hypothetical protein
MARVIDIKPVGALANKMIQFLAAWKLQRELEDTEILNPNLPEWGIDDRRIDESPEVDTLILDRDKQLIPFSALCDLIRSGSYGRILIADHMQRMECLPDRLTSASLFSSDSHCYQPRDDELLINVRSAELAWGFGHYPLVPADFYERIIKISGRKPVFMGQIGPSAYCEQLKRRFPTARFLESQGAIRDFQTLRQGSHIVISVSTFSWLAAWLSQAQQIYLPMLGFLNPMHFGGRKGIDLLPADDPRYRFFMFPLHYGLPECQALRCHTALTELCREVSPQQVNFLRTQTPLLKVETPTIDFDEVWYTLEYMQAALEISEGWFAGPLEHYIEIGMRRGYRPLPPGFSESASSIAESLVDISLHKRATQSSLSEHSVGANVEEDASRALTVDAPTPYAFHTREESDPWWSVDLEDVCRVQQVVVLNRSETEWIAGRAAPLVASASLDRWEWATLFTTPDGLIPGRDGKPLIWTATKPVKARFVRLSIPRSSCLHLRQVRILGFRANCS